MIKNLQLMALSFNLMTKNVLNSEHDRGAKAAGYGYSIEGLALETEGTTHNICDEDYSSIMTQNRQSC